MAASWCKISPRTISSFEDGVKQTLISFQHTDLPVSMGLMVDNSGSMYRKRPSVNNPPSTWSRPRIRRTKLLS